MSEIVAVVPFGSAAPDDAAERAGRWARQIARRLVERFAGSADLELRPVFLVALPEQRSEAGYLVFGSTPDAGLAANYGRSLGASRVLTGTYREEGGTRRLEAQLVSVAEERTATPFEVVIPPAELHLVERPLAEWLARATRAAEPPGLAIAPAASEDAYAALLEAMDAEVDATLLRSSDPGRSDDVLRRASAAYAAAARADPGSPLVEERILVLAATAIETGGQGAVLDAIEALAQTRPQAWRVHYVLGEVRRTAGDASGAVVAFEHADALEPLRPRDSLELARLHLMSGSTAAAGARLRRILRTGGDPEAAAAARRLFLGLRHPELERDLETAGRIAVEGEGPRYAEAEAAFGRVLDADPEIWEAHFGLGLLARERGESEAARLAFARAVELNPAARELVAELGGWKGAEPPAMS